MLGLHHVVETREVCMSFKKPRSSKCATPPPSKLVLMPHWTRAMETNPIPCARPWRHQQATIYIDTSLHSAPCDSRCQKTGWKKRWCRKTIVNSHNFLVEQQIQEHTRTLKGKRITCPMLRQFNLQKEDHVIHGFFKSTFAVYSVARQEEAHHWTRWQNARTPVLNQAILSRSSRRTKHTLARAQHTPDYIE